MQCKTNVNFSIHIYTTGIYQKFSHEQNHYTMVKGWRQDGKNIIPNTYWALASLLSAPALIGLLNVPSTTQNYSINSPSTESLLQAANFILMKCYEFILHMNIILKMLALNNSFQQNSKQRRISFSGQKQRNKMPPRQMACNLNI